MICCICRVKLTDENESAYYYRDGRRCIECEDIEDNFDESQLDNNQIENNKFDED